MSKCENCIHNEVCTYGENRSNGMYCTGEKCRQYKDKSLFVELKKCSNCVFEENLYTQYPCSHCSNRFPDMFEEKLKEMQK